jgi:competence protein ComEA
MTNKLLPVVLLVLAATVTLSFAADESNGVVNINTASVEQLQLLPRIGPALSQRIIEFREANGPFKSTDELVAVKGIGERSIKPLKPYITVKGDTTLKNKVRLSLQPNKEG